MSALPLAASWKAGTIRQQELSELAAPLVLLARQNLKAGRLSVATDYLELLYLASPSSREAMGLRAELAKAEGNSPKAEALTLVASCL